MRYKDEECPKCGNYVRGQIAIDKDINLLTRVGKSGALAGIDSIVPYLGTGIDVLFGNTIDKCADSVAEEFTDEVFAFECPRCGHSWKTDVEVAKLTIPDSIIEQVRGEHINEIKKKRPYISAVICTLSCLYGFVALIIGVNNKAFFEGAFQIVLGLIIGIIFLIPSIYKINRIKTLNHEIETIESFTCRQFLHEHKELFNQYLNIKRKW